jgi:hypothetical protein
MNLDNLKSAFAKERHAELMIGTGGAILIATMTSILDPETLKLLEAQGPIPGFLIREVVWGISMLVGIYLVIKGLNRIDAERAASKVKCDSSPTIAALSITSSPISIEIKHGNTVVSINIQPEKNSVE